MAEGPNAGLDADRRRSRGSTATTSYHAARADLLRRLGGAEEAQPPTGARSSSRPTRSSVASWSGGRGSGLARRIQTMTAHPPPRLRAAAPARRSSAGRSTAGALQPDPVRIVGRARGFVASTRGRRSRGRRRRRGRSTSDSTRSTSTTPPRSRAAARLARPRQGAPTGRGRRIGPTSPRPGPTCSRGWSAPATAEGGDMLWLDEQDARRRPRLPDERSRRRSAPCRSPDVEVFAVDLPHYHGRERSDAHALAHLPARGRPRASSTCR